MHDWITGACQVRGPRDLDEALAGALSDTASEAEHAFARTIPSMTDELIERAIQNGHTAVFSR